MLPDVAAKFGDAKFHHGDAKRRERGQDASETWDAFCREIAANGVLEPIKVTGPGGISITDGRIWNESAEWQIVDGRHRYEAAKAAGLAEIPVHWVPEDVASRIMEGSLIGRRHFSKSGKAWLAVSIYPQITEAKAGNPQFSENENRENKGLAAGDVAKKFGISHALLSQACDLYRKYHGTSLFDTVNWLVWGGTSLGGIEAGLGYLKKKDEAASNAATWSTAIKAGQGLFRRLSGFTSWAAPDQQLFKENLAKDLKKLGEAERAALREALEASEAAAKKAAA
jgi:hypothetical protein